MPYVSTGYKLLYGIKLFIIAHGTKRAYKRYIGFFTDDPTPYRVTLRNQPNTLMELLK